MAVRAAAGLLEMGLAELAQLGQACPLEAASIQGAFCRMDARIRNTLPHWDHSGTTVVAAL
eukprot:2713449-Alexandrium_andersonii.AAC.1